MILMAITQCYSGEDLLQKLRQKVTPGAKLVKLCLVIVGIIYSALHLIHICQPPAFQHWKYMQLEYALAHITRLHYTEILCQC